MVKMILPSVLATVFVFLFSSMVLAGGGIASWEYYTPPEDPPVSGFKLYRNGVILITFAGDGSVVGDIPSCVILNIGDSMTLTAAFSDGTESPHSPPYIMTAQAPILRTLGLKTGNTGAARRGAVGARIR